MADIEFIDPPQALPFAEKAEASPEVRRWGIRPAELVVLSLILILVVSVGLPAIHAAREAARRIQCTNNLKHCGLGVHNFHDTYNGLPPLALGGGRASMFVLILPFNEEAGNIYNLVNGGNQNANTSMGNLIDGSSSVPPISNWAALTPAERDRIASFKLVHCPSRRSGIQQTSMHGASDLYAGPLSDYAVVFLDQDINVNDIPLPDVSPQFGWQRHQDPCDSNQVVRQRGAIRLANVDCSEEDEVKRFSKWKPRDTFARITDGTANTIIVGEKHLRTKEIGKYSASQDDQDGVYWFTSNIGGRNFNVARNIRFPLAKGKDDPLLVRGQLPARGPHKEFGFGSWHTGVVPFLRADGSVHFTSMNVDPMILGRLGHAQDVVTCCEE